MNKSLLLKYSSIILSSTVLIYCLKKYFLSENDKNRLDKFVNKNGNNTIKVEKIIVYPIKACCGIELNECKLSKYGFENDRRWMIIKDNRYVSQKACPVLATVKVEYSKDGEYLIISKQGIEEELKISTKPLISSELEESRIYKEVAMFDNKSQCYDEGDIAAKWFSKVMNDDNDTSIRLVQMLPDDLWSRNIRVHMAENLNAEDLEKYKNSLSNSCQVLMISKSSINHVNLKIEETRKNLNEKPQLPLTYDRYRPNILLDWDNDDVVYKAFEEDNWKRIKISDVEFPIADSNARCPIVTIDQDKGIIDPYGDDEPLRTLKTYRKVYCKQGEKVLIGSYVVVDTQYIGKSISVGDNLTVLETGFKSNYFFNEKQ